MKKIKPLDYKKFRQRLDISQLAFKTTQKIKPLHQFIGQERALEALNFGIGIKSQGYNLYAMGPPGIGKNILIRHVLESHANKAPTPPDWCYIYNFAMPDKPIALQLPAGEGQHFQQEMKNLLVELSTTLVAVFESDEFCSGMKKINSYYNSKRVKERKQVKHKTKSACIPHLFKERHDKEKELQVNLMNLALDPIINNVKRKYIKFLEIIEYLSAVQKDLMENINEFIRHDTKSNLLTFPMDNPGLTKYKVNLLVDNSELKGAPIIFVEAPSYSNIICRVEHIPEMGTMVTNFSLIKPGALHRANGGFLVIEARKFGKNQEAWEALKSALYSHKIKIEPIQNMGNAVRTISLEPDPIPLDVKVILLGDRNTYYMFCQHDPDFTELFKVPVDFDEQIERNKKNVLLYARMIGTIVTREKLRPFAASAVAEIIDFSTRLAEDIEKLSTHIKDVEDLIIQADYWASFNKKKTVVADDVKRAIEAQVHRMDRSRELYYEDIQRNFIIINTAGKLIGQLNCLSVRKVGNYSYGHPTRVTARVRLGQGKLIDIQREIKMAGPMHAKAGLIISNFLASRFNKNHFFSLSASIAFEQVYCWTDGDSASVGELCALLSALAEVPLYQFLAVTGSIDQYGEVQAVGGLNEKIEGFFDVCKAKGLTGKQGVLIPAVNTKNLMLREDIVAAAKKNKFFIYPISTVDEAITLLTGMAAGKRDKNGLYPKNSIYHRIEKRLQLYSRNSSSKFQK